MVNFVGEHCGGGMIRGVGQEERGMEGTDGGGGGVLSGSSWCGEEGAGGGRA